MLMLIIQVNLSMPRNNSGRVYRLTILLMKPLSVFVYGVISSRKLADFLINAAGNTNFIRRTASAHLSP